jgi:hypothetical protein
MSGRVRFSLEDPVALCLEEKRDPAPAYPTASIQKGITLWHKHTDLSEEGVGFGLPVMKRGRRTIYPGSVRLSVEDRGDLIRLKALYNLNIGETLYLKGKPARRRAFDLVNEWFSMLHRRHPALRAVIDRGGINLRSALRIERKFEEGISCGEAAVSYEIDAGRRTISVGVDLRQCGFDRGARIFMMNELGANHFDQYRDSRGFRLKGEAIGTWEEVRAGEATFLDSVHSLSFTLPKAGGARMFRGRELVPGKLAWAGLAYALSARAESFRYTIIIKEEALR